MDDVGAAAAGANDRDADAVGSGVMMLTGGVEAALGKSALVGLPVGMFGAKPASTPTVDCACGGAFHCEA